MATYVVSDIHGYYYRFMDCLAKANFDPSKDTLYVLGDIADRGPNSDKMIDWMFHASSAVRPLKGNHEDMMLAFFRKQKARMKFFRDSYLENEAAQKEMSEKEWLNECLWNNFYNSIWAINGGLKTWEYLMCDIPIAKREDILKWINSWPLFYIVDVNGKKFLLVHAGLAIRGMCMSDDYYNDGLQCQVEIPGIEKPQHSQSLLWVRENWLLDNSELPYDVIFGHTPSPRVCRLLEDVNDWNMIDGKDFIPIEKGIGILHFGKDLKKHCIDTGRAELSILRLEDMKEFNSDIEEVQDEAVE